MAILDRILSDHCVRHVSLFNLLWPIFIDIVIYAQSIGDGKHAPWCVMVNLEPIDVDMVLVDLPADIGASGPPADINDTSGTAWLLVGVDCGWTRHILLEPLAPPPHGWGGTRTDLSSPTGVRGPRGGGARIGLHAVPRC